MIEGRLGPLGPILPLRIERPEGWFASLDPDPGSALPDSLASYALIDTGALVTVVSPRLAALGAPAAAMKLVGVHQKSPHELSSGSLVPAVFLTLRFDATKALLTQAAVMPIDFDVGQDRHVDVLIGRNVLQQLVFIYDGPRATFRVTW